MLRGSARVELDHQVRFHLDRIRHLGQGRDAGHAGGHLGMIDLDVVRNVALGELARHEDDLELLRLVLHLDHVPGLHQVAGDVDAAAVDLDVAVIDELARGEGSGHELGAVDDRIETALEQADQVLARVALHPDRFRVVAAELLLGDVGVVALELLLSAQLRAEVAHLALAALAVLAWAVFAAVDGALRAAPDVLAHAAIKLVLRLDAFRHRSFLTALGFGARPPLPVSGTTAPLSRGTGAQNAGAAPRDRANEGDVVR